MLQIGYPPLDSHKHGLWTQQSTFHESKGMDHPYSKGVAMVQGSVPYLGPSFASFCHHPHHAGTSQPSGATLACEPCLKGEYQDLTGQQTCKRCDVGYYQDEERGPICKKRLGDTLYTIFQFFTIYREITACCVFEVSTCQCFSRRRKKDQTSTTKSVLVERLSIALTWQYLSLLGAQTTVAHFRGARCPSRTAVVKSVTSTLQMPP